MEEENEGETIMDAARQVEENKDSVVFSVSDSDNSIQKRLILDNMDMIHTNLTAEGAVFNSREPFEDIKVLERIKQDGQVVKQNKVILKAVDE